MKILKFDELKEDLGRWLMDVAKYVTTAVIITAIFQQITSLWITIGFGALTVFFLLLIGIMFLTSHRV